MEAELLELFHDKVPLYYSVVSGEKDDKVPRILPLEEEFNIHDYNLVAPEAHLYQPPMDADPTRPPASLEHRR